jgi:hypothetical protein
VSLSSNSRKKRKSNSEEEKFDSKEDEKFDLKEDEKFDSKKDEKFDSKEDENLNLRKEKSSRTTQRFSVIDKTQDVLNYMRKLRLSILDFLQEIVKIKFMHKHQIIKNSQLFRFFVFNFNDVLNLVNWKREEYRKKLSSLFENKYFKNWKIENMNSFETNSTTMIKKTKARVSRLLSFLRFIISIVDQRFERHDMKSRWIFIISILCFTYKSRTCVRWLIMWDIQLHVNEIKRRVIENLFHTDLTIEYKSILNFFRKLTRFQQTSLKLLDVENKFIIIWDNFEQIKAMKHQRIDNKDEFFSIIIAQILKLMWMFSRDLRQDMFDQIAKLNWLSIVKHENLNSKSLLSRSINATSNVSLFSCR